MTGTLAGVVSVLAPGLAGLASDGVVAVAVATGAVPVRPLVADVAGTGVTAVELALVAFVLATAVATAAFRDILSAIIVFAAYSLGMAILYAFLLAPDVALTEAAIGAGVTTLLLLLTITRTVRPSTDRTVERVNVPALVVVGVFLALMLSLVAAIPPVGSTDAVAWANPAVTQHYLAHAYAETGVGNAVTAVLAAYRGFDTVGEAVVVFAAGVAILLVLDREVFA